VRRAYTIFDNIEEGEEEDLHKAYDPSAIHTGARLYGDEEVDFEVWGGTYEILVQIPYNSESLEVCVLCTFPPVLAVGIYNVAN
jgi:hypothetical protein